MDKSEKVVFIGLKVLAWAIFVSLCVEAGGFIVNFVMSIFKPEWLGNLYQKLDLSTVHAQSEWVFYLVYGFILIVALLKACLFYLVIRLVHKLDLSNPFNNFVANQISLLSYCSFAIGILSSVAKQVVKNLLARGYEVAALNQFWTDNKTFILMSAVILIIASIFKKGVEIQNENDLTV
ncbi:MAG: DUF2975 domain-containing protein [Prolixibacteraceae bacterium]|nr:DUF2975 domain-containing protein [Prolixibacteraceae bacterium]